MFISTESNLCDESYVEKCFIQCGEILISLDVCYIYRTDSMDFEIRNLLDNNSVTDNEIMNLHQLLHYQCIIMINMEVQRWVIDNNVSLQIYS